MAMTMPFMMLALNFGVVAALWFGGMQVKAGSMAGRPDRRLHQLPEADADVADDGQHAGHPHLRVPRPPPSASQEVLNTEPDVQPRHAPSRSRLPILRQPGPRRLRARLLPL